MTAAFFLLLLFGLPAAYIFGVFHGLEHCERRTRYVCTFVRAPWFKHERRRMAFWQENWPTVRRTMYRDWKRNGKWTATEVLSVRKELDHDPAI